MGIDCKCGNHLDTTTYPSVHSGVIINDVKIDTHCDKRTDDLYAIGDEYEECPQCRRLIVFHKNGTYQWYLREEE